MVYVDNVRACFKQCCPGKYAVYGYYTSVTSQALLISSGEGDLFVGFLMFQNL